MGVALLIIAITILVIGIGVESPVVIVIGALFIAGLIVAFIVWLKKDAEKTKMINEAIDETKNCCHMRMYDKTLYVDKLSKQFRYRLAIAGYEANFTKHIPEQWHVGSVTVGGVTTGGVYKTGGYDQVITGKTEKSKLMFYIIPGQTQEVWEIVLTKELADKARKSNIKKYLKGDTIKVVDDVSSQNAAAAFALSSMGRSNDAWNVTSLNLKEVHPTEGKCIEIIQWLSQ